MPVLRECTRRGIAFVPFFPLGSAFARPSPLLGNQQVISIARRLGHTPAQVALAWVLGLAPNVLLIPGTSSLRHPEENLAVADIHVQGDVAWAEGRGRFTRAGGGQRPVRMTGVFVREDGRWKVVQSHASIGVPNDDIFG